MSALMIESWIKNLGRTHEALILQSLIEDKDLLELFPGIDELYLDVEPGISMSFWEETGCFERIYITLIKTTPSTVEYKGELPPPYTLSMNQSDVHRLFGNPLEKSGPLKLPKPVGSTGGWESYALDPKIYPNTKVVFQYSQAMDVNYIVFTLIDKGHE